jgi:large subunit ribosomal protein L10
MKGFFIITKEVRLMPSEKILKHKKALVDELAQKLKNAKSIVLADYRGLTVDQDTKLRKELREADVEYKVIKNSIISFAIKDSDLAGLGKYLTGPTAVAISTTDPVAPSKVLAKFAKDFNKLEIKGGMAEGNIIDIDGIKELASTPSKEELLGRLIGSLQSSLYGLAIALDAIAEKQEQAENA